MYHTFVYPYLSYCIHVWGKAYNIHLNDLIVLQNKAMRMINVVPPRTNMDKFYTEKNILTVKHIFNYNIGLFMFKYVNNITPDGKSGKSQGICQAPQGILENSKISGNFWLWQI